MAVSARLYGPGFQSVFNKEIDWDTDTIKCALMQATYTPDQDAHRYFSQVSAHEVAAGSGYTSGGAALTGKTVTYSNSTNVLTLDADDVTWPASSITAAYAVVYQDTGNAATSPLIGFVDFGSLYASNNSTFSIIWNPQGAFVVTVS